MSKNSNTMEAGKTYVINVPPGWILAGTVVEAGDDTVTLKDCLYVESIGNGHSALGSIARAGNGKELQAAISRYYVVPDGMTVQRGSISIFVPCQASMKELFNGLAKN